MTKAIALKQGASRENSANLVNVRHWFYNSRGSLGCLPVVLSCPVQTKTITINDWRLVKK